MHDLEERKQLILDQETTIAKQLARRVLERPTPPIWMIFIPIFFVFHAWRIKQYGTSLKSFADNHLQARRCALDAAASAVASGQPPDLAEILSAVADLPPQGHAPYRQWLTLLIDHYRRLLSCRGASCSALFRNAYGNFAALERAFADLAAAEQEVRLALITTLDGDQQHLRRVVDNIAQQLATLNGEAARQVFP